MMSAICERLEANPEKGDQPFVLLSCTQLPYLLVWCFCSKGGYPFIFLSCTQLPCLLPVSHICSMPCFGGCPHCCKRRHATALLASAGLEAQDMEIAVGRAMEQAV